MLANSKGQKLSEHSFAVGYLARKIVSNYIKNNNNSELSPEEKLMTERAFLSGILHDIGKTDPNFQKFIMSSEDDDTDNGSHLNDKNKKFSFETYPRHNELSLIVTESLFQEEVLSDFYEKYGLTSSKQAKRNHRNFVNHCVLWHHSVPIRKNKFETYSSCLPKEVKKNIPSMIAASLNLLEEIDFIASAYQNLDTNSVFGDASVDDIVETILDFDGEQLPSFKTYPASIEDPDDLIIKVKEQSSYTLIRSSLMIADRIVSELDSQNLSRMIEEKRLMDLVPCVEHSELRTQLLEHSQSFFPGSERTLLQIDKAKNLSDCEGLSILKGAAGSGKTKIACEWALKKNADKLLLIVPRVSVGLSLYTELVSNDYLPSTKIQLHTGEIKKASNCSLFDDNTSSSIEGDVVITTIDQVVSAFNGNKNVKFMKLFLDSYVIFDEFHEFTTMTALNVLFAELVNLKRFNSYDKCLLISATPNYLFLRNMFDIDIEDVISMDSYNDTDYRFIFEEYVSSDKNGYHPSYEEKEPDSLVITNTVFNAQCGYAINNHENSLLAHSYYSKTDKEDLIDRILASHGRAGDKSLDIVRSAPIIQASFNISFSKLYTDFTTPEDMNQRVGRVSRFGEKDSSTVTLYIPESIKNKNKNKDTQGLLLNSRFIFSLTHRWYEFLQGSLTSKPIKVRELYDLYDQFYEEFIDDEEIEKEFVTMLNQSLKTIKSKVHDPIWVKAKKTKKSKLSSNSLRGDSFYGKMAKCEMKNSQLHYCDEYLDELIAVDGRIVDNVLDYFVQQHPKIEEFRNVGRSNKSINNNNVVKLKSRSDDFPIFLSYTPDHLDEANQNIHDKAVYYAYINGVPIGYIEQDKIEVLNKLMA